MGQYQQRPKKQAQQFRSNSLTNKKEFNEMNGQQMGPNSGIAGGQTAQRNYNNNGLSGGGSQ